MVWLYVGFHRSGTDWCGEDDDSRSTGESERDGATVLKAANDGCLYLTRLNVLQPIALG